VEPGITGLHRLRLGIISHGIPKRNPAGLLPRQGAEMTGGIPAVPERARGGYRPTNPISFVSRNAITSSRVSGRLPYSFSSVRISWVLGFLPSTIQK
jgi:hypothetical protein